MQIAPFTIAVDQREGLPYRFNDVRLGRKKAFVCTISKHLKTGDYSIVGYEDHFCIERKSLVDLYQTLISHRDRFEEELARMQLLEHSRIVIEADWRTIADPERFDPTWPTQAHPNSVLGIIVSLAGKFPATRWKTFKSRSDSEKYTFKKLAQWYEAVNQKS